MVGMFAEEEMVKVLSKTPFYDISLLIPPTVTESPVTTVQVLTPAGLSLNCTADGLPLPTISWVNTFNNGSQIEYDMDSTDVVLE